MKNAEAVAKVCKNNFGMLCLSICGIPVLYNGAKGYLEKRAQIFNNAFAPILLAEYKRGYEEGRKSNA